MFGRPIGANQGVQFPIARAHMRIEAADLMRWKAAWLFDAESALRRRGQHGQALASEASWEAANACLDTHGGFGFAAGVRHRAQVPRDAPVPIAPISNNLVQAFVAQHVLGLPRSY